MQKLGIAVATVDAIAEKKLAKEHGIESFPTLKLYRGSPEVSKPYKGPRTAEKMTDWLKIWQKAKLIEEPGHAEKAVLKWARKQSLAVLGLLSGDAEKDGQMREVLERASFALNPQNPGGEVPVGESSDELLSDLQAKGLPDAEPPCIVLFRDFEYEPKMVVYQPEGEDGFKDGYEDFMAWLKVKRVQALIPAKRENEDHFLQNIDAGNALAIYFGSDKKLVKGVNELAVKARGTEAAGKIKWVHAEADEFGESFAKSVGISKAEFPEVVMWEFGETEDVDKVYRFSHQPGSPALSKKSVKAPPRGQTGSTLMGSQHLFKCFLTDRDTIWYSC